MKILVLETIPISYRNNMLGRITAIDSGNLTSETKDGEKEK